MTEVFVRSFLIPKDQAAFDKALASLKQLAHSAESDFNLTGFAVCAVNKDQHGLLPSNDDPLTLMVVERYQNSTSSRKPICLDDSLFRTQTTTISTPEVNLTQNKDQSKDSSIITASFLYQIGRATKAVEGWQEMVNFIGETEDETYNYSVFQSVDTLSTFEVYSSPEYVANVHLKSPAIAKNGEHNGQWRVKQGIYATRWHLEAGFLYRA